MKCNILPKYFIAIISLCYLVLLPMAGYAQESDSKDSWQFIGGLYFWGASVDGETQVGDKIDVGFGDIFDGLDLAFMGGFEARKSKWHLTADVIYLNISADESGDLSVPGMNVTVPASANVDLKGWILGFKAGRLVWENDRVAVRVLAGARYLNLDMDLTVRLTGLPVSGTLSRSGNVWDGIIGTKGYVNLTPNWYLPYYIDVGTGESDFTFQGAAGIGYRFKRVDILAVYRYLYWDLKSDRQLKNISFGGPMLGVAFRF